MCLTPTTTGNIEEKNIQTVTQSDFAFTNNICCTYRNALINVRKKAIKTLEIPSPRIYILAFESIGFTFKFPLG